MCPTDNTRARNRRNAAGYRARRRAQNPPLRQPGQSDRWDKPYRVLSTVDVAEIRRRAAEGTRHQQLAEVFDISRSHVSRIVANKRRKSP